MEEAKSSSVNIQKIGDELEKLSNKYREHRKEENREALEKKTKEIRLVYKNMGGRIGASDLLRIIQRAEKLLDPTKATPPPSPFRTPTPQAKQNIFPFPSETRRPKPTPLIYSKSLETLPTQTNALYSHKFPTDSLPKNPRPFLLLSPSELNPNLHLTSLKKSKSQEAGMTKILPIINPLSPQTASDGSGKPHQDSLPKSPTPSPSERGRSPRLTHQRKSISQEGYTSPPQSRSRSVSYNGNERVKSPYPYLKAIAREFSHSPEDDSPPHQGSIENPISPTSPPSLYKESSTATDLTHTNIPLIIEEEGQEESPPENSTPPAETRSLSPIITSSTPNTLEEENHEPPYLQSLLTSPAHKKKRFGRFMAVIVTLTSVLMGIGLMASSAGISIPERLKFLQDGADFLNNVNYGAYIFSSLGVVITICAFLIISRYNLREPSNPYQPVSSQEHESLRSQSPTHLKTLETLRNSPHPNPPPPENLTARSLPDTRHSNVPPSFSATTNQGKTISDDAEVRVTLN